MSPAADEKRAPTRDDLLQFAVEKSNERIMVFDAGPTLVFRNEKAGRFLDRHGLPEEIPLMVGKILAALARGKAMEVFSGLICFHKEISGRNWLFRVAFREGDQPLVGVFFNDETVSGRFDLNSLREQYRLTRRETDVLRHLLDGLKNHEIAEELTITAQTVKDYLSSIYQKVGAPDRFSLLRLLICATQK
ncbi:MAG: helix-turn-helix transcriptional regulator [Candidatus Methylomirabilia bacterium]